MRGNGVGVWYISRDEVMAAPDIKASAYAAAQIDRACESASRQVGRTLHRRFYPLTATKYFDYPHARSARAGRLWLDEEEVVSLTGFVSGGITIPQSAYYLEPANSGPPYTSININRGTSYALSAGSSASGQRSQALTGVFGFRQEEESVGALAASLNGAATTLTLNAPARVGDLLRIDSERLQITEKAFVTSTQVGTLALSNAATALPVSDGTQFAIGDELLLDSERMMVTTIAGNTVFVQRAWGGTALAAHTAATIFYARSFTVLRAAAGTTTAAHAQSAPVVRNLVPGPVKELALAYALDAFFQAGSGYARTVGSGDNERMASGRSIKMLEDQVYSLYGRRRTWAV